jgi:uncharacterized protein
MLPAVKRYKYTGLFIALVLPCIFTSIRLTGLEPMAGAVVKESLYWFSFILLLLVARYGEQEAIAPPAGSSAVKTAGIGLLVAIGLISINIAYRIAYHVITKSPPPHEAAMDQFLVYPVWLKLLMVVRAGVIEETFFRAYGISRIQQLSGNKYIAIILPLVVFSLGHYSYGTFNHVFGAFFLGLLLTLSYLKTKNLAANIIGHTVYDGLALFLH